MQIQWSNTDRSSFLSLNHQYLKNFDGIHTGVVTTAFIRLLLGFIGLGTVLLLIDCELLFESSISGNIVGNILHNRIKK